MKKHKTKDQQGIVAEMVQFVSDVFLEVVASTFTEIAQPMMTVPEA